MGNGHGFLHGWHDFRARNGVVCGEVEPSWRLHVHAIVFVVADAIRIHIGSTVATTDAQGVELVAGTITVAFSDVFATALIDVTRSVADATSIKRAYTIVHVVADAIGIRVLGAIAATGAQGVKLVAVAVAVSFGDVSTSTIVDVTWSVADATSVKLSYTIVLVVANAIGINVLGAIAATDAQGVKLVAVTVAIPFWERSATAGKYSTWAIANPAFVRCANAFVHVVANAIGIRIIFTRTSALTKGVFLVAITVAFPCRDVGAAAPVDRSRAVANATAI